MRKILLCFGKQMLKSVIVRVGWYNIYVCIIIKEQQGGNVQVMLVYNSGKCKIRGDSMTQKSR